MKQELYRIIESMAPDKMRQLYAAALELTKDNRLVPYR